MCVHCIALLTAHLRLQSINIAALAKSPSILQHEAQAQIQPRNTNPFPNSTILRLTDQVMQLNTMSDLSSVSLIGQKSERPSSSV